MFGWVDVDGDGCNVYENFGLTSCSEAVFFAVDGVSANHACCFCGGG